MPRLRTLALAATMAAGTAALASPAMSQYVRIGHVDISHHGDHATQWNRFGGRMEGLRLVAEDPGVHCKSIRVQYGNGHWDRVFKGRLHEGHPIKVDLKGHSRMVRRIRFVCGTRHHRQARIKISADLGPYVAEWRSSPFWNNAWTAMLNGGHAPGPYGRYDRNRYGYGYGNRYGHGTWYGRDHWQQVSAERFGGHRDHERAYLGRDGRHLRAIALEPHRNDAHCRHVRVTFHNGRTRNLDIGRHERLQDGQLYPLDLPGHTRNVRRVDLVCHGVHHDPVLIDVLARR